MKTWTCLKENIPPHAEDLLFYFDYYYVNGTYRRVGTASSFRLQGWNNRFSKLCGHKRPTIWNLIKKMKMEVAADQAKLALSNVGDYAGSTKLESERSDGCIDFIMIE
ncbi:Uncharacterized protein FWK35_00036142 [Aphis craccivora]|uniref:Uncharacterized protein n=1 Tax=Aphis craccivora TaxID=307492 RepID=A0A6G0VPX8_APHCR|nr:Uncharacterized protein FWK35_00036142 [Aphis craccivora]